MAGRLSKFIGDRNFYKMALVIAIPLMMQQLITSSVNLVDNLMVGQLGDAALGGVAAVNRFYIIAMYGTNGMITAAAIFIAQFFGAKDEERMKQAFRFSILSAYAIMIPFYLLGSIIPHTIMSFFTSDPLIIQAGGNYMQIAAWSFLPLALSLTIASAMRAVGETRTPLVISAIAVLTNTFLNYCLIFGHFGFPQLGVEGAALATLAARFLETGLLLVVLYRMHFDFKTKVTQLFHVPLMLVRRIMAKAAPLALNEVLWSMGMASLFKFYSTRGAEVMSGYAISTTIGDIFFVLFGGMAAATTVLVSQYLGADKLDQARDHGYQLLGFSMMLSAIFATLMFTSSFIVPHFYQVSLTAKHVAANMLQIMSVMFWIYMGNTQCYFILRAGGDTRSTLFMDSGYMWLINIPVVWALAYFTNVNIIILYVIGQLTDILKLVIAYTLVRKEKWVVNLTHHHE